MIIRKSSTNEILIDSMFMDGKRIREKDIHIEHKVGDITYIIYLNRDGVFVCSEAAYECGMILKPRGHSSSPEVLVTFKKQKE